MTKHLAPLLLITLFIFSPNSWAEDHGDNGRRSHPIAEEGPKKNVEMCEAWAIGAFWGDRGGPKFYCESGTGKELKAGKFASLGCQLRSESVSKAKDIKLKPTTQDCQAACVAKFQTLCSDNNSQACWDALQNARLYSKTPLPPPGTPGPVATVDYKTFQQGDDNACWIGAAVSAFAFQRPEEVKRMMIDLSAQSAGMWGVTFPWSRPTPRCRLVHPNAADAKTNFTSDSTWARVIHLGLVRQLGEEEARNPKALGWAITIKYLTGNEPVHNSNLLGFGFQTPGTSETVQMKLAKANDKKIVIASTGLHKPTGNAAAALGGDQGKGHVYAILAYDKQADRIRLRNPWGGKGPDVPKERTKPEWGPSEFWMTVAEYEENFQFMAYEK